MNIGTLTGALVLEDQMSGALHNATSEIKKFASSFDGLTGTIMKGSVAMVGAIAGIAGGIVLLGQKGSTLLGVEEAFDKLAQTVGSSGATMFDALNAGLRGTVDSMEIMQATTKLLGSGIRVSAENMNVMAKTAREMAKATGTDAATSLNQLSQAVQTGNTRMLKRLGINVDLVKAETEFANSLGTVREKLNQAGIAQARANAIFAAMSGHLQKTGESALSFKERVQQATVAVGNWFDDLAKGVAKSTAVSAAFDAITKAFSETFGGTSQALLQTLLGWVDDFAAGVTRIGPIIIQTFGSIKDWIVNVWNEVVAFNDRFQITNTIIAGAKAAWSVLQLAFELVKKAVQEVTAAWSAMPDWLQKIAAGAAEASITVAAFGVGVAAVASPVAALISKVDLLVNIFGNLSGAVFSVFGLLDRFRGVTTAATAATVASTVATTASVTATAANTVVLTTNSGAIVTATTATTGLTIASRIQAAASLALAFAHNSVTVAIAFWQTAAINLAARIVALNAVTRASAIINGILTASYGLLTAAIVFTSNTALVMGTRMAVANITMRSTAIINGIVTTSYGLLAAATTYLGSTTLVMGTRMAIAGLAARVAATGIAQMGIAATATGVAMIALGTAIIAVPLVALVFALKEVWQAWKNLQQAHEEGKTTWEFLTAKDSDTWVRRWTNYFTQWAVGADVFETSANKIANAKKKVQDRLKDEDKADPMAEFRADQARLKSFDILGPVTPSLGGLTTDFLKASTAAKDFQKQIMDLGEAWAKTAAGFTDNAAFTKAFENLDLSKVMKSPELQAQLIPNIDKLIEGHHKLSVGMQEVRFAAQSTQIALMAVDKAIIEGAVATGRISLEKIRIDKERGLSEEQIAHNIGVSTVALQKYISVEQQAVDSAKALAEARAKVERESFQAGIGQIVEARQKLHDVTIELSGDEIAIAENNNRRFTESTVRSYKGAQETYQEYYDVLFALRKQEAGLAGKEALKAKEKEYANFVKETTLSSFEFKKQMIEQETKEQIEGYEKQYGANAQAVGALTEVAIKGGTARIAALEKERLQMMKNTNIIEIMAQGFVDLADVIGKISGETSKFGRTMSSLTKGIGASLQMVKMGNATWKDYKSVLIETGGVTGTVNKEQANLTKNFGLATALFDKNATSAQKWGSAVASGMQIASGAMAIYEAGVNSATKAQGAFAGAMAGAQAGAAFGAWGAAIGGFIGAIGGLIAAGRAGRKAVKEFAESFDTLAEGTGFDELRAKLLELGPAGDQMWKDLTQGSTGSKELAEKNIKAIQQAFEDLEADVDKYGLTWRSLTNQQAASDKQSDKLVASFKRLTSAGYNTDDVIESMSADMSAFVQNAVHAGVKIPQAMQPVLQKFIEMEGLSQDAANALLGLSAAGVPSLDDIREAADRYGISLDALGPKVKQLEITELADQYVTDWNLLTSVTDDWSGIIDGMQPKIQELITDAMKFGSSLPTAMKPMIQAFIDAGRLVDDQGNALTDLGQLKWEVPLAEAVDSLIKKMDELIDKIVGGIGGALDEIGNRTVSPTIAPRYIQPRGEDSPPVEAPAPAAAEEPSYAARGGRVTTTGIEPLYAAEGAVVQQPSEPAGSNVVAFRPRGTDTVPAMLTPGETILPVGTRVTVADTFGPTQGPTHVSVADDFEPRHVSVADDFGQGGGRTPLPTKPTVPTGPLLGGGKYFQGANPSDPNALVQLPSGQLLPQSHPEYLALAGRSLGGGQYAPTGTGPIRPVSTRFLGPADYATGSSGGGGAAPTKVPEPTVPAAPTNPLGMSEEERKALLAGYTDAKREGFAGTINDFLRQQLMYYETLQEGDPRLKTWFYGKTGDAYHKMLDNIREKVMLADEQKALLAGYADVQKSGFGGSLNSFMVEQLEFYKTLQEGDPRLKTWISGRTGAAWDALQFFNKGGVVQEPSYYGQGGNVLPFKAQGPDTVPAMLTPGERVLSVSERSEYEAGGGGTAIMEVDGQIFARAIVPKMRKAVKRYKLANR